MTKTTDINEKIQKLLALAGNNPSDSEAKAAMLKAQELMFRYHIDNPETVEDDKVVAVYFDLKDRRKTEFVLMISVVVAQNFRCKTLHNGQKVYFFGFDADAKAAMEVFVYLLTFGDAAHDRFFAVNPISAQADQDWRYGFIVGLHEAFNSRKGFELMTYVPQKVIEAVDQLNRAKMDADLSENKPRSLHGAFKDGFRRGKESMDRREIEVK